MRDTEKKLEGTLDDVVSLEGAEDDVEEPEDQEETRAQPLKIKYILKTLIDIKIFFSVRLISLIYKYPHETFIYSAG